MAQDLLTGSPGKKIVSFALPMLLGNVFQQLYNIVDTIVVGRFMGETALAAVSAAFPMMFIINAVSFGMTVGASVLLAQLYGAGQKQRFEKTLYTTAITMVTLALIMTVGGQFIIRPALKLIATPGDALEGCVLYLRFIFGGLICAFVYNTCAGILRAIGDSKTPIYFMITACIANTILDVLFVAVFDWGIAGAAGATVTAEAIGAAMCLIYIKKKVKYLSVAPENRVFEGETLKTVLRFGVPTMLQQLSISVSILCVQGMVNSFGTAVVAGYGAASKVESVAMMPMLNISSALATFTAQNIGAGREDRAKQGLRSTLIFSCLVCGALALVLHAFRYELIVLFLKEDASPLVYEFGCGYLGIVCLFYAINAAYTTLGGMLRGTGDTSFYMVITAIALLIRVGASYLMLGTTALSFASVWWGLPIAWTAGLIMCYLRYRSGAWRKYSAVKQNS